MLEIKVDNKVCNLEMMGESEDLLTQSTILINALITTFSKKMGIPETAIFGIITSIVGEHILENSRGDDNESTPM